MKEHTIFATVFLILVVGFVSFNVGGATGEVFEDRQWRATFADSQYTGPVTAGGHSAREFESTNINGKLLKISKYVGREQFVGK